MSSEKSPRFLTRGGFTLVELLIVIVVIGILSAMMMLSSTEAVTTAKANNIISNLRNWKTAMLAWYMDNIDKVKSNGKVEKNDGTGETNLADDSSCVKTVDVAKYLNGQFTDKGKKNGFSASSVKDGSGLQYWIQHYQKGNDFIWCIGCEFPDDHRLEDKLASRAHSAGLIYANKGVYKIDANGSPYDNAHRVWIEVIDFSK